MSIFGGEKIWRWLTNFWTIVFLIFIIVNFFNDGRFEFLITPFSILYVGVLSLYVSTKEFDRWYELHKGKHPGEIFVILWTIVIIALFAVSVFEGREYKMSTELVADYVAVLSIFAITQKSKRLHEEKMKRLTENRNRRR